MTAYLAQINFGVLKDAFPPGSLLNPPFGPGLPALTLGNIISAILPYLFVIAGLVLLFSLILGGIQLMTSQGDPKAVDKAKGQITNAIIGFLIIFVAFWIARILQVVLGLPTIF